MDVTVAELQRAVGDRYRVERELGAGGMATVYLAHDDRHDRRVAIKVLRPELAAIVGGERFLKEIRTTANLQHPHILPLHDSGSADGTIYYVMPYVEGESLRSRLQREKQLPVDDAVRIAREVAGGLDYAHRHGVVHRDIKPENILLHDGQAIIADFGIALAVSRTDGGNRMTETGMSLGTPNYMSPEQAMGEREVTARSDVYALGCVLYEMLVGEPPFTGPTPQAVIARVLTDEPRSLTVQRRTIPSNVEATVLKALEKIPADRFATAAQFADALSGTASVVSQSQPVAAERARIVPHLPVRKVAIAAVAAAALLVTGAGIGRWAAPPPPLTPPARFAIRIPADHRLSEVANGVLALSPDGRDIVYVGQTERGDQLYRRQLEGLQAGPIVGTEGASAPIFAPSGAWIAFGSAGGPQKLTLSGGAPVRFAAAFGVGPGGLFALPVTDVDWLVGTNGGGLALWSGAGEPRVFAQSSNIAATGVTLASGPFGNVQVTAQLLPVDVLPDGRALVIRASQGVTGPLYLVDRSGKATLVADVLAATAKYQDGLIAWVLSNGTLLAASWDEGNGRLGEPITIATNVRVQPGSAPQIGFSRNGALVYAPSDLSDLVLVDRGGNASVVSASRKRFHSPRASPDGRRIAFDVTENSRDVWVLQRSDGTVSRVTFDNDGHDPHWLPDSRTILYAKSVGGTVGTHRTRIDGSATSDSILHDGAQLTVHATTRDGTVGFGARISPTGDFDIVRIPLRSGTSAEAFVASRFSEQYPALSPDGEWFAYTSDETGTAQVYVRPIGDASGRMLVSLNGGTEPVWSRDGRELYYRDFEGPSLIAARIETRPELRVASRTRIFKVADYEGAGPHANYDVTSDGRFVFVRTARATELIYVQNWPELVRRKEQR